MNKASFDDRSAQYYEAQRKTSRLALLIITTLACWLNASPLQAASIGYVQSNSATPQTAQTMVTVTFTAAQSAGDLNVVVVGWNDTTATVGTVTDTAGNVYTRAVGPTAISGLLSQSIYYAKNIAAAAAGTNTITVSFSPGAAYPDIRILEYSGADPNNPVDVTAASSGNSATSSTVAVTTSNATDLLFGANIVATTTTGPGTGFTRRLLTSPDGDIAEDEMVTATGSYSATAKLGSGQWIMQMVAFRTPTAGDTTPPTAPSNLTAAVSGSQINLSWTASTDNVGVTGYLVERCLGAGCATFAQIGSSTTTTYSDTGLALGSYSYRVRATDGAGNLSAYSNIATTAITDTTPPTAPGNLTAAVSGSQINLSWTASTDNVGVTGYRVERCQGAGCTTFAQIAAPTATVYSDTGLGVGNYSYRVRATDAAGNLSAYSNTAGGVIPDTQPPTAPSNLTAAVSGTQINLSWTASTDNVGVTGYLVERCQGAGCATFAQIAAPTTTAYSDTSLAVGSYSYRVRATDAAGNLSAYSNIATTAITDTTPPTAPSNLTAAVSGSQINLSWTASTDNVGVTGYRVERCQGAGCTTFAQIAAPTVTTYSDTGLSAGSYSYRVRATDAAGNLSTYSNVATGVEPDTQPPTAPASLTATEVSTSQISLGWIASTDNVGVTGYLVERCQGAGCATFLQIATPAGTSYNDTGLTANASYSYRVRATDAAGNLSPYSNIATASTSNLLTPTAPTNLAVIDGGPGPAVTAVQSYDNRTALPSHTSAAFDSTGGDVIVVCASSHVGVTMTPTDTFGNNWISIAGPTSTTTGIDLRQQAWYVRNPIVGPGHTVTISLSAPQPLVISVFALRGSRTSSPIDAVSLIGSDNGTQTVNVTSPSITTTSANDLLIGFTKVSAGAVFQSVTGFTQQAGASSDFLDAETGPAATPGSYDAGFTLNLAQTWQAQVVAVANNPNQTTLSWTASTDTGATISSYLIERCQGTGCSNFAQMGTATGTTFNDPVLTASTSYSYRVRAQDTANNLSPYSTVVTFMTPAALPSLPGNLTASTISATQINLSWVASAETGGTISDYLVERCQVAGCSNFTQIGTAAGLTFSDTVTGGVTYNYRVRAMDTAGNLSPYSNVAAPGVPTITWFQSQFAGPQSPQTAVNVTFPLAQLAGDLNVIAVGWNDSTATVTTVTDTSGNVYTRAVGPTIINGLMSQSIYYAKNIAASAAAGNTVTVTFSIAAAYPDVRILEYNGADPNNPVDVTAASSGSSALSSSGSVTTSNATDLLFGANLVVTNTSGPGAGFTTRLLTSPDGDIAEEEMVTTTGSYSATAPVAGGQWIMQMVAFRTAPQH